MVYCGAQSESGFRALSVGPLGSFFYDLTSIFFQVTDDVFTREAEKTVADKIELEKQRESLERALQKTEEKQKAKLPVRKLRTPDEEDKYGTRHRIFCSLPKSISFKR